MSAALSNSLSKLRRSSELWGKVIALLRFSDRRLGLLVFGLTIIEIGLTLCAFYVVKLTIDVIARTENIDANTDRLFLLISLVLGLFMVGRIAQSLAVYYRAAQGYVVSDFVNHSIQERAVAADLSFYDSPLYFDSLERARQAGAQRPAIVIGNALNVMRGVLMMTGIIIVLAAVEWRLLPIILVAVGLILIVQIRFTRERFERQKHLVQKERQSAYADWLMTTGSNAKEIRLWGMGEYLRKFYMDIRVLVRSDYRAIERRKAIAEVFATVTGTLLFVAAGGLILMSVARGESTLAELVLIVLLLQRAETAGRDLVAGLSRLYDDQLFLNQLFGFLDLNPEISAPVLAPAEPQSGTEGLRVENVSFAFPGSERLALDDVSLQIKPAQFAALVGGNGSGKTTLVKLMCRLYDPQKGRITYGGVDIRDMNPSTYRKELSVIFQDFVQYAYSGRENIKLADLAEADREHRITQAAKFSGAHDVLLDLPKGYDTILSRMFNDGVELSGGQWQKLALARAIYPTSKFVILDEPTSAIDPNAEAQLFDGFRDKIEGRGALVISHRLSTIRQADYTYVLEKGRIVEHGTPDELIAANGLYAEMFARQGRGYK